MFHLFDLIKHPISSPRVWIGRNPGACNPFQGMTLLFLKEKPVMPNRRPELLFSFLTFKLSAKGVIALLLALPVGLILTAIAWRIFHG